MNLPALDPLLVVLGFLDDYMGRWIGKPGGEVEHFYVNERPVACAFRAHLEVLAAKHGIRTPIERTYEDGHIWFRSRALAAMPVN